MLLLTSSLDQMLMLMMLMTLSLFPVPLSPMPSLFPMMPVPAIPAKRYPNAKLNLLALIQDIRVIRDPL